MYIRLVVTYCNSKDKIIPKEAHIDNDIDCLNHNHTMLNKCIDILNKKLDKIKAITPAHLKNKDFDIIVHGQYLIGYDWLPDKQIWGPGEAVFNIQQLGVPEENRPIIKTS